jgi:hypothetical protein
MICFLDRSFCSSDCINSECKRCFTDDLRERAKTWWGDAPGEVSVAFADFKSGCPSYMAPTATSGTGGGAA